MDAELEPARNPRLEAEERLNGRHRVRVLEPSPPAVGAPWFADDPATSSQADDDQGDKRPLVSPIGQGDLTWDEISAHDADLAAWCAERSLGAWPRLPATVPADYTATRLALQAVAEHVACATRFAANGKIGLRYTIGGFGTSFFAGPDGDDRQVRVERGRLVVQDGSGLRRYDFTTLGAAAEAAGVVLGAPEEIFTPSTPADPAAHLDVDEVSATLLGDWYGLGTSVLEQLRAEKPAGNPAARVQLWPEHFDLGTDLGAEVDGTRVTFGASPGDEPNPTPYLYVLPWAEVERGGFWNADSFPGAILPYADVVSETDQRQAALDFFRQGSELLTAR